MFRSKKFLNAVLLGSGSAVATLFFVSLASAQTPNSLPIETVISTGSLITNSIQISPVTIIDQATLDDRGISTIQSAIQSSVLVNGPALTNSFTANGAFASGASAASLRGMTTNSTLVLFDGLRASYYPLADDGSRNFVDLNTIPDDIVDRIEILRDGASARYGADAIAGVINIITKKEFNGFSARMERGMTERGGGDGFKFSATAGIGDLSTDNVNFYLSGFYLHDGLLSNNQRPFPYNTADIRTLCYEETCGNNGIINGVQSNDSFALSTSGNFLVRPGVSNADGTFTAVSGSKYQAINGCANGTSYTLSTAQQAANPVAPATVCQYDYQKLGGVISPAITRFGVSGHAAFNLPAGVSGWVEANLMQSLVEYNGYYGLPGTMYGNAPTGIYNPIFSTSSGRTATSTNAVGSRVLYLPVYVCPERINCSTSANKKINSNNPFASEGKDARIIGRDWYNETPSASTKNRSYRLAGGVKGMILNDIAWNLDFSAMHTDLQRTVDGFVYIQHLLDVINDGTYNFTNPTATSKSVMDYLRPTNRTPASSDTNMIQAYITTPIAKLSAGDLTFATGASYVYEAVDAPSANSDINGPTQRYFVLNAFGTSGSREVYSGFSELNVPILSNLTVNASARYDSYTSGQSHFSPKIGVVYEPFSNTTPLEIAGLTIPVANLLTLKGTYSEGFRVPSFGEAYALPTTGYVSNSSAVMNNTFLAGYNCTIATFSSCPNSIRGSYGQTTLASPNLKPETSRSWVGDLILRPTEKVSITFTYYNIIKSGAITTPSNSPALTAYYSGAAIPAGYTVIANAPDPSFPNARPTAQFVQAQLINANTIKTSGVDMSVTYNTSLDTITEFFSVKDFLGSLRLITTAEATYIQSLNTYFPDGNVERYAGTIGNYNLTAGTGTPSWRALWQTTVTSEKYSVTGTLNFFDGYNLSAMDQGTGYRDCGMSDGSTPCRVEEAISFDLNINGKLIDNVDLSLTVKNVFDTMPPIDTVTYGAVHYNPVQSGDMIYGRYFRLGARINY